MYQEPYLFAKVGPKKYRFKSDGKKVIFKLVEFTPTGQPNIFNLAFGDLLPDDKLDDKKISDNGDITKVFATVIQIVIDFTAQYPFLKIFFSGSSPVRTKLYERVLKMNFPELSQYFIITGVIESESQLVEVDFEPTIFKKYLAFFVQRKTYI